MLKIKSISIIVRILTGVKRTSSSHGHKTSSKRSYLSDSQSSITHTGSPVNPMTAKALASKLNERNNLLNGTKKGNTQSSSSAMNNSSANDIPIPPLISIQTASTTNRFKDGQQDLTVQPNKFSHSKNFQNTQNDGHCKPDVKHQKSNSSSKHVNGTNSVHQSKTVNMILRHINIKHIFYHILSICSSIVGIYFNDKYDQLNGTIAIIIATVAK